MIKKEQNKTEQNKSYMSIRRQILNKNSSFIVQEAYKSLRTNVRFYNSDGKCKKMCITSGAAGEGKSITLLNLAISIGESGKKVLLIDADLRRPSVARLLVEKSTPGLSNILVGQASVAEALRKDMYRNLDVILSGDVPPNPSELIGSEKMQELIEELSTQYDYILVDTPPVGVVSDTCLVANFLDGVLVLAWQGRSQKEAVRKAVNNLNLTGAKILGYVLNGVPVEKKSYHYYYY